MTYSQRLTLAVVLAASVARNATASPEIPGPPQQRPIALVGATVYPVSRAPIPGAKSYPRLPEAKPMPHLHHMGIYGYRRDFLLAFSKLPHSPLEGYEELEQLRGICLLLEDGSARWTTPVAESRIWPHRDTPMTKPLSPAEHPYFLS